MASSFQHLARRTAAPAAAYLLSASTLLASRRRHDEQSSCEAPPPAADRVPVAAPAASFPPISTEIKKGDAGAEADAAAEEPEPLYHCLFPLRQLHKPKVEYPLFDHNWDGKRPAPSGDSDADKKRDRHIRRTGVTRHIILVRHGQYDETHKEDEKRILTPLGREQADATGRRLAEMIRGIDKEFGPCNVKTVRVSGMARAQETAEIICAHLPDSVERSDPDPLLNEGRPCHHIPGGKASESVIAKTDEGNKRIEEAYRKYFYRADRPKEDEGENPGEEQKKEESPEKQPQDEDDDSSNPKEEELKPHPKHEFEIIVCHANVIRYFACRALQIPPEAWLRMCTFNCSLTYLTIRPTGSVSIRMLGDIGHLGLSKSTFSGHHGFNW